MQNKLCLILLLFLVNVSAFCQDTAAIRTCILWTSGTLHEETGIAPTRLIIEYFSQEGKLDSAIYYPEAKDRIMHYYYYDELGRDTLSFKEDENLGKFNIHRTRYPDKEVKEEWWTELMFEPEHYKKSIYEEGRLLFEEFGPGENLVEYRYGEDNILREVKTMTPAGEYLDIQKNVEFDSKNKLWELREWNTKTGRIIQQEFYRDPKLTQLELLKIPDHLGQDSLRKECEYDENGKLIGFTIEAKADQTIRIAEIEYNENGHVSNVTTHSKVADSYLGETVEKKNERGELLNIKHLDKEGNITSETHYDYSDGGKTVHMTRETDGEIEIDQYSYYDASGRLIRKKFILPKDDEFSLEPYDGKGKLDAEGWMSYQYDENDSLSEIWWVGNLSLFPLAFQGRQYGEKFYVGLPHWVKLEFEGIYPETLAKSFSGDTSVVELQYIRPFEGDTVHRKVWVLDETVYRIIESDTKGRANIIWHHWKFERPQKTLMAYWTYQSGDTIIKKEWRRLGLLPESRPFYFGQEQYFADGKLIKEILPRRGDLIREYHYRPDGKLARKTKKKHLFSFSDLYEYDEKGNLTRLRHFEANSGRVQSQRKYYYPDEQTVRIVREAPENVSRRIFEYTYYNR